MSLPVDKMLVFTPRTSPMLMERFTWRDYEAAMKIPGVIKPTVEIDDRLVKDCQALTDVQPWQVQGERKRREEMQESPLSEESAKEEIQKQVYPAEIEAEMQQYIEAEEADEAEEETAEPEHEDKPKRDHTDI
jgi:hypothetical protein